MVLLGYFGRGMRPSLFPPTGRYLAFATALLLGTTMFAQPPAACIPLLGTSAPPKELVSALEAHYKVHNEAVDVAPAKVRKAVLEDWTHLQTDLIESLNDEHFIFGTPLNSLLDSITALLVPHLPGPSATPRVLLSWYPWPNASCRGEGTIVVNIGMLERLNSRAELAFILGHELAHHYFDHVGHGIEQVHTRMNSDEFQAEVNAVLRQEFDRVAQLEALFISFSINERRHGRNHELVSDSLALRLMQAAGFDALAAPSVMDVLEACDDEVYERIADPMQALLDGGADPTGDWNIQDETSSLGGVNLSNDSLKEELKTHPDCDIRKAALFDLLDLPSSTRLRQRDSLYLPVRETAAHAVLESALVEGDMGRAVFVGLQLLTNGAHDGEVHAGMSMAFDGLWQGMRLHLLSEVLQHPSKNHSEAYQRTLKMLNRLRMRDHAALAAYHLAEAKRLAPTCEHTLFAQVVHAANGNSLVDLEQAKKDYASAFPEGRYSKRLATIKLTGPATR